MSSTSVKLFRLRGIFVAYYVLKSAAGAIVAWGVFRQLAENFRAEMRPWTPGVLKAFSLAVTVLVLVLAWLVFGQLLQRRNWARLLLLVLGWLAVLSALFSLLTASSLTEMSGWLARLVPGIDLDWEKLLRFDRVQKVFELLFWGYLIAVLQFDRSVRAEFQPGAPAGAAPGEPK